MRLAQFAFFAPLLYITPVLAAPQGQIGFLGIHGAQVWHLTSGKIQSIAGGQKADDLTISPRGDAMFFVPTGKKSKQYDEELGNGFLSRSPYKAAKPIAALQGVASFQHLWSAAGNSLYLGMGTGSNVYTPATGRFQRLYFLPTGFDARGQEIGYSTEDSVLVRNVKSGQDRVLFSTKKPKPLFDALRRAKYPKNIADLLEGETAPKEAYSQWQVAGPVLSPDATRAYFASNAGTGFGAAGNGSQGFFAVNLKSGVISVLSKVGPSFGRPPEMTISPDGKRILAVSSVHSSAADNSSIALLIDLETQNSRELVYKMPGSKDHANFFGGAAWSPDGKYLAISAYFYDADKLMNSGGDWPKTPDSAWKTAIFEAATGQIWGIKTGMRSPQWIR